MNIIKDLIMTVASYLKADWMILLIGILIAVSINVYIDPKELKKFLEKNSRLSISGSVAFGAFTPLCACGTMAVLLSMFISAMPWGPVMAFLVSSPLTSPSEYMFQTSFLGSEFANTVLIASIVLGITAGAVAHLLDKKTYFFKDQFRFKKLGSEACCNSNEELKEVSCCSLENRNSNQSSCCNTVKRNKTIIETLKLGKFVKEFVNLGLKKVLVYFIIFIALGRLVEILVPQEWVLSLFSSNKGYSIPLGATIGLPLYVSGPSALPLMKSFLNSGAGEGVILAFLITGKATGVPVIAGMTTILKKRAILFYVGFVYLAGIVSGYIYQLVLI